MAHKRGVLGLSSLQGCAILFSIIMGIQMDRLGDLLYSIRTAFHLEKQPDRGSEEDLHRLFLESGWTDGLPIVLPTEERVAEMLEVTSRAPE